MALRRISLVILLFSLLLALPAEGTRRIAILDLENQSGPEAREQFSWMGLNVPETLAGKLSEVPGVQVIERAQWKKLVDELRLSLSDLFNEEKAAKLGERLGAQVMGFGSFAVFKENVNLTLRFVDVETGKILGALNRVSPVDGHLFEAFAALALEAVEVLNREVISGEVAALPPEEKIEVPEEIKEKIEKPATKTFDAYALYGKGKEAHAQNHRDEAIALHRQAISLDPDYADAWQELGEVLRKRRRFDEAEEAGRHALSLFTKRGDEKGRGLALRDLGAVAKDRGRFDEADRLFRESLAIERRIGHEPGVASSLIYLGNVAFARERFDEAEGFYQEGLAIDREIGNEQNAVNTLQNLGVIAKNRGRLDEAQRFYQESLAIERRIGHEPSVANTLNNLGIVAKDRGRYDEAERFYQESLMIRRKSGNVSGVAQTLFNFARLADLQGSRGRAIRYARQALEIRLRIGSPKATETEQLLRQLGNR